MLSLFGLLSNLPFIALIARNRVWRAWVWWALLFVAALGFAVTAWAGAAVAILWVAVFVDGIRVAIRRPPADAPRASGLRWLHLPAMMVAGVVLALGLRLFVVEAFKIPSAAMLPTLEIGDHILANKLGLRFGEPRLGDVLVFRNPCTPEKDFVKRVVALPGDRIEIRCDRLYRNGALVPSEPVAGACTYDDFDERAGTWMKGDCQRHRERLGDVTHDVLLMPDATAGAPSPHDFPEPGADDAGFVCHVDRRNPAQRAQSAGQVVSRADVPVEDVCAQRAHFVVPPDHVFVLGDNRHNSSDSRMWGPVPIDHLKARVARIWWSAGRDGMRWDRFGAID